MLTGKRGCIFTIPGRRTQSPHSAKPKHPVLQRSPYFTFRSDSRLSLRSTIPSAGTPNAPDHGKRGFTLIDLILVVIILGVLAMVVLPQLGAMANQTKLNNAAWELVMAFQYTQTLAIEYQRPFQLKVFRASSKNQFLIKDHTSSLDDSGHPDAVPPLYTYHRVYNPMDKKPYIIDFDDVQAAVAGEVTTREEYRGVTIDSVPGGGSDAVINFYPDGHSGSSDSVVVMSLGSMARTITVDGITGKVSVE